MQKTTAFGPNRKSRTRVKQGLKCLVLKQEKSLTSNGPKALPLVSEQKNCQTRNKPKARAFGSQPGSKSDQGCISG